jgi:hypothetical protein
MQDLLWSDPDCEKQIIASERACIYNRVNFITRALRVASITTLFDALGEGKKINKKGFIKVLLSMGIAVMLAWPSAAVGQAKLALAAVGRAVSGGSTWVVNETTNLSSLTIAEGAAIKAPDGKSLTMTVDRIGMAIRPGVYKGDIRITVVDKFFGPASGLAQRREPQEFRTAILIEDGKYAP